MLRRLNALMLLAALVAAFALYSVKYDTRRLEARVEAQERALEKAQADVTILTAERTYLARPERLEPLARLIGMVPIASTQYLRLGGSDTPPGDGAADAAERRAGHAQPRLRWPQDTAR
ncbi:MAG TPA: cell division protein FtsL [Hyphomicrobiaceae bacterium]|nr:cell division protein FtsL [Hyphomicrobiaceae bacterium]